jgi:hypothetical protein
MTAGIIWGTSSHSLLSRPKARADPAERDQGAMSDFLMVKLNRRSDLRDQ